MTNPGMADRAKLAVWADSVASQTEFPRLVRRLILETTPGLVELGMPAGEGVAAGGWDGSAKSTASNAWVPEGLSVWELSVNKSPGSKADDDYSKRLTTPDNSKLDQCVYVEAILRPWTKRTEWAAQRTAEGRWRSVKAYGLDDIETWLETAPVTWSWISEQLGLHPHGMRSAEAWWDSWARQTRPSMSAAVVLSGRETTVETLRMRLGATPQITTISGASLDEIRAFIAAMGVMANDQGDGQLLARTAFVDDREAWRSLLESKSPLVLVPMTEDLASEVPSGCVHHILVPVRQGPGVDVELPPIDASLATKALLVAGITDQRKADEAGRLARRSLTALRRNLAIKPALHVPAWAKPTVSRTVRACLLVGSWSEERSGDKQVLADLAGQKYDEVREGLTSLADIEDPFVLRLATEWHLVSPYDAWLLLRSNMTEDDLNRLQQVVNTVLGEDDPALTLAAEDRWKASLEGKVRLYSADLRRGLTKSLALLATHGEAIAGPSGTTGAQWAAFLVRQLLDVANNDSSGARWASISTELSLLSEAAPDVVIDAIRAGATGKDPVLATAFADSQSSGPFGGSSPHTYVLWALETLAWSSNHFGAAIDLLARLDALDPGGRLSNRPFNSLAGILCPWHPETSATSQGRLAAIDGLISRHNALSWRVLMSMLPSLHGIHHPSVEPTFRDWKIEAEGVTQVDYLAFVTEVVNRSITQAGENSTRWTELLDRLPQLPASERPRVVGALDAVIQSTTLSDDDRETLWRCLRALVRQHLEFAHAQWALPGNEVQVLDTLCQKIEPTDVYVVSLWLFTDHRPFLGGAVDRKDHAVYEMALADARKAAVASIETSTGLAGVRQLLLDSKVPGVVGWALGQASEDKYVDALLPHISTDPDADRVLALDYFAQRANAGGLAWVEGIFETHPELSPEQEGRLLLLTRDFPKAWQVADDRGAAVANCFWRNMVPYGLGHNFSDIALVADRMMQVGRNAAALDLIGMYLHGSENDLPETAALAARGLDGLLTDQQDPEIHALSEYDYQMLFGLLERHREVIGEGEIGRLEWNFLPALGYEAEVPTLHSLMASSPAFFVDVLSTVYRRHEPDTDDEALAEAESDDRRSRAENGYRLLTSWSSPPGVVDGAMDAAALKSWFDQAMELLLAADRVDVGLSGIGEVLVYGPADTDGTWPAAAVRDLFEEKQNDVIESGFTIRIANSRGVTSRGLEDGGTQEVALVAKYLSDAELFKDAWPRTAAILRRLAERYSTEARRNEDRAERFRRGVEG